MVDHTRAPTEVLAANLRRLRIARHLSLSELARATGMSKATLSGIENGRANPTVETLASLAGALRVPVAELLAELPLGDVRVVRAGGARFGARDGLPHRLLEAVGDAELAEIALEAGRFVEVDPKPAGARAGVYVLDGPVVAGPVERATELGAGDFMSFPADAPYGFEAPRGHCCGRRPAADEPRPAAQLDAGGRFVACMGRDMDGLTRREIVAAGLAGSGAWLLGGAPARASAAPERLPLSRWRRAQDGWWTSGPVRIPRGADTLGVRALHGSARIRSTTAGGRTGAWTPLGHGHSERASDPVWVGDSRVVELEVRHPRDLQLLLVDSGAGPAPARGAAHAAQATAMLPHVYGGQPAIIARSAWANRACAPRVFPPGYGTVDVAIVHHTETTNAYGSAQSAAIVRGICLYHIRANGWNDIGYDFLIDRYGRIFEGRAGGFDEPVVGAHAGGFNGHTTGIALIGSFSYGRPSPAALRALNRLLAFKLSLHGVPATGSTRVTSGGTVFSRYRAGRKVTLQRISGHRDVDTTACPGSALYALLPGIRRGVARSARTVNTLSLAAGTTPWVAGQPAVVSGRLATLRGAARIGRTVLVQQRVGGAETTLATVTTGADGSWSAGLTLTAGATLRAAFTARSPTRGVISPSVFVPVACAVTLTAPPTGVAGQPIPLSGGTNPPKASVTIVVTQLQPDGTAPELTRFAVPCAADGSYQSSWTPGGPATYRLTALTDAGDENAAGTSAPVDVVVG